MRHEHSSALQPLKSSRYAFLEWLHENGFASDKDDVELKIDREVQSFPMLHTALEGSRLGANWSAENERSDLKQCARTCPRLLTNLEKLDQCSLDIDESKLDPGLELRWRHYDLLSENCFTQIVYLESNVGACLDVFGKRRVVIESNLFDPQPIRSDSVDMGMDFQKVDFPFGNLSRRHADMVVRRVKTGAL